MLPIPEPAAVRQYLRDAAKTSTTPVAVIVRVPADSDSARMLVDWIAAEPAPICTVQVLAITDSILDGRQGTLDVWIEEAARAAIAVGQGRGPGDDLHPDVTRRR